MFLVDHLGDITSLTAAFDTVRHNLFNPWNGGLESGARLSIGLFDSLTTESVESAPAFMSSGVPEGSNMGTLLFNLYMLCLEWINQKYKI